MKIDCVCGASIHDGTDALPHKAHVIPDPEWFRVLDAIDEAVEASGPTDAEKEAALMKVRILLGDVSRLSWQCSTCGRLYLDDRDHVLRTFEPADGQPNYLFRTPP